MKKGAIALVALAFALSIAVPVLAENAAQEQQAGSKALRTEIIKLKYVRAQDIQNLIYSYVSRDGHIQFSPNLPAVLVVRDTRENVERILAAVRELDVKPADILYTVQLVLGSETDARTDAELQNDPVVKELRQLLRYKGYTLLDSTFVRVVNRTDATVVLGPEAEFEFSLEPDVAGDVRAPVIRTSVRLTKIARPAGEKPLVVTRLIESSLNIKSGERTVVGVSKLDGGDKGLILIISGKIVD